MHAAGKTLRFTVVQYVVFERFKKNAVAFGMIKPDGTMQNAPGLGCERKWDAQDRIIIFNRVIHRD
jgi:hypothetical protein